MIAFRLAALLAAAALPLAAPARGAGPAPDAAGAPRLEGDPFRGRELLTRKLCTRCHSVWGHGGTLGPEMSTAVAGKNLIDLVGDFWNHTPRMIDAVVKQGYSWPTLQRAEMADLLSYLYYLRVFDRPGDPARGSFAWERLQCASCHSVGGKGGTPGGPLDRFSGFPSPVVLAQAMWNAGPAMQREQLDRPGGIPVVSGTEIADLQAHIRARGLRPARDVELLLAPDPGRGAAVFRAKRCGACHPVGGGEGPDLRTTALHRTVAETSGVLWNHSYAMGGRMRARGIPFPRFAGTEMADLLAYLSFLGFFSDDGDPAVGASLFREKGCSGCHGPAGSAAADLSASPEVVDPVTMAAAMWNHAPEMHELMARQAVAWPTFERGDMSHLAAHLRRLSSAAGREP